MITDNDGIGWKLAHKKHIQLALFQVNMEGSRQNKNGCEISGHELRM